MFDPAALSETKIAVLAKMVHEVNRVYCEAIGDHSIDTWDNASDDIKESAISGVKEFLENPEITPEELHEEWMKNKKESGYVYGEEKDDENKTHPCLVDYSELSAANRYKDKLFIYILKSYVDFRNSESDYQNE